MKRITKFFNFKLGFIGAVLMSSIIFGINFKHGGFGATIAATKQGLYTLFIGGFFVRMSENISLVFKHKILSIILSTVIPSFSTSLLTFIIHSCKGTPEPLLSTIPTIIITLPGFLWVGSKKRYNKLPKT